MGDGVSIKHNLARKTAFVDGNSLDLNDPMESFRSEDGQ
jgi:hypothetical protein